MDDIDLSLGAMVKDSSFNAAVRSFQAFSGLPVTGSVDQDTRAEIGRPRCTNRDIRFGPSWAQFDQKEKASYQLNNRWGKNRLTWRITKFASNDLPDDLVVKTMNRAFAVWERHADLGFSEASDGVGDIEIRFEAGDHGDGDPFDR